MNVLILGDSGRDNAIARKALKSNLTNKVFAVPGNSGMDKDIITVNDFDVYDLELLEKFCRRESVELIIVNNEGFLSIGVVDYFNKTDIKIFGPSLKAATIEFSKDFSKTLMNEYEIDTAKHYTYDDVDSALNYLDKATFPVVIKEDGLAFGKGVLVANNYEQAKKFVLDAFERTDLIIFEEFLEGKEFSLLCFINGTTFEPMPVVCEYKRVLDGDKGPLTAGMGAHTPVSFVSASDITFTLTEVIKKTLDALKKEGIFFKGVLHACMIKTDDGIKVIEFNARFNDSNSVVLLEKMNSDIIEVILALLSDEHFNIKWSDDASVAVCVAASGYPNDYDKNVEVTFLDDINYYSMALKKEDDKFYSDGGRVVMVSATSEDLESARIKAYKDVNAVSGDGLVYRTDIGVE